MSRNFYGIGSFMIWVIVLPMCAFTGKATEPASDSQPRIEFDSLEHDFGDQVSGKILAHTFTFKNTGSAPLSIKDVKAG